MADKTYIIYGGLSTSAQPMVLGTTGSGATLPVLQQFLDPSRDQTWTVIDVLGTPYVWIRHEATGLYMSIPSKIDMPVVLSARDILDPGQFIRVNKSVLRPGFVSLADTSEIYTAAVIPSLPTDNHKLVAWNSVSDGSYWLFA